MADRKISDLPLDTNLSGNENLVTEETGSNARIVLTTLKDWLLGFVNTSSVLNEDSVNFPTESNQSEINIFFNQSSQSSSNVITFKRVNGAYFGSWDFPLFGEITIDENDSKTGAISVIYYRDSSLSLPFTPKIQVGDFVSGLINKIYIERDNDGYYYVNIISESGSDLPEIPTNINLIEL